MERSPLPLLHGKAERLAERKTEVSNHRFIRLVITILALSLTLLFTSCGSTSADAETKTETETADHPCYHVTVYSPEIEKVGYGSKRHPKYTITVENFSELIPVDGYIYEYKMLKIPLGNGRFELVSTSLVEIEYY